MKDRFDIEQVIRILGLNIRADQADGGADFDVACNIARKKLWKIKEYEDLEQQGKLLELPCKLGDKTFWISDEDENGNKVLNVREGNPIVGISVMEDGIYIMADGDMDYQKVGTRWAYLTREEAEAALTEL